MNISTQRATRQVASRALSLYELGHDHYSRGDIESAEAAFREVLKIEPNWLRAKIDFGCILQHRSSHAEAELILREALDEDPQASFAHNALGLLLWNTKRLEEAETHYREAIRISPDFFQAHNNLGLLHLHLNKLEEAESAFRRALSINANSCEVLSNYGSVLWQLGTVEQSIRTYRQALALKPDYVTAKTNLAHPLLAMGEYKEGWSLYESRFDPTLGAHFTSAPPVPWPMWNGEPLAGKSLIVWPEQGYGDILQFCRYTSLLKALGLKTLSIACPPALERLFENLDGVDCVYPLDGEGTIARHDYWCYVMSLPHRFGTTTNTVPASIPYLRPPTDQAALWQDRLPKGAFRVGLVWAGDPRQHTPASNAMDRRRSVCVETLMPILRVPGVTFVSLQKGAIAREQIARLPPALRPFDPMDGVEDFADTAAIIASLDLVIAVDTSIVHLAGALGKPVWVLSRYAGCWRWLLGRDHSPWYPSMRLFRQREPGNWAPVIEDVCETLQATLSVSTTQ